MQDWDKEFKFYNGIIGKGILVSKGGCMYPHAQYCTVSDGKTRKAYQYAAAAFYGIKSLGDQTTRNSLGWPNGSELSHLCHHHKCCNPAHVQTQPVWRNRKRNYCGFCGECDCGNEPACLGKYTPYSPMAPEDLCQSVEEVTPFRRTLCRTDTMAPSHPAELVVNIHLVTSQVQAALASTFARFPIRLMTASEKATVAEKAKKRLAITTARAKKRAVPASKETNKMKRQQKGEKQAYRAARKAAQRAAKALALRQCQLHSLQAPDQYDAIKSAAEGAYLKHLQLPAE